MRITGEEAKKYTAVRLDSFESVNKGELVSADDQIGEITFKDTPETTKTLTLGPHAIRIVRK